MTEYDYSEEGYQRYLDTQRRISKWVDDANAHYGEYRHPFGARSESSSSSSGHGSPRPARRGRTMDDSGGRRRSLSVFVGGDPAPGIGSGSGSGRTSNETPPRRRSMAYEYPPQARHSYPSPLTLPNASTPQGSPAPYVISPTPGTTTTKGGPGVVYVQSTRRRAQSLHPPQSSSSPRHHHYSQHHHHRDTPPQRSSTLPASAIPASAAAYLMTSPSHHRSLPTSRTHSPHSNHISHSHLRESDTGSSHPSHHRPHDSGHHHHPSHHHRHSRSQSTPRSAPVYTAVAPVAPGGTNTVAIVGNHTYTAEPGSYMVIPSRRKKMSVVYAS